VPLRRGDDFERPPQSPRNTSTATLPFFLLRQAAWLVIGLLGMFVLMRTDYRKLREPAVVYPVVCIILLLLVGICSSISPTQRIAGSNLARRCTAFGARKARRHPVSGVVSRPEAARQGRDGIFAKKTFCRRYFPRRDGFDLRVLILLQPDLGTSVEIVLFTRRFFTSPAFPGNGSLPVQ